jgi:hypothetical protein
MDSRKKSPLIKHCPICRVAMVGDRSDSRLPECDLYRCLSCDSSIAMAPSAARREAK